MPPRKSQSIGGANDPIQGGLNVEDLGLPRTMVQRLIKGVLPPNTSLQREAVLAISKSATVFVNYLTSHANENAARANKKTIQPKDVFDAIKELEFESFLPRLEMELERYNAIQCDKRNSYRRRVREEKKAAAVKDGNTEGGDAMQTETEPTANGSSKQSHEEDAPPAAKKARRSSVGDVAGGEEMDTGSEGEDEPEDEEQENEDEDGEDEEDEDEDEDEDSDDDRAEEQLQEDLLESREARDVDDHDSSGDDSD